MEQTALFRGLREKVTKISISQPLHTIPSRSSWPIVTREVLR